MSSGGPRLISGKDSKKLSSRTLGNPKGSSSNLGSTVKLIAEQRDAICANGPQDELLYKHREPGDLIVMISFNDMKQNFDNRIYALAKRQVYEAFKESGLTSNAKTEEVLSEQIQEIHQGILKNKLNECKAEIEGLKEALDKCQAESRMDEETSKTKKELTMEIQELAEANAKSQEVLEHMNQSIKEQINKFNEDEKNYQDQILELELELKRTRTEDFIQLKDDNKKLIEENICLHNQKERLENKVKSLITSFNEMSQEAEDLKNAVVKELDDARLLVSQLNNEKKMIELEKVELLKHKKAMIRRELAADTSHNEERTDAGRMIEAFSFLELTDKEKDNSVLRDTKERRNAREIQLEESEMDVNYEGEMSQEVAVDIQNIKTMLEKIKDKSK